MSFIRCISCAFLLIAQMLTNQHFSTHSKQTNLKSKLRPSPIESATVINESLLKKRDQKSAYELQSTHVYTREYSDFDGVDRLDRTSWNSELSGIQLSLQGQNVFGNILSIVDQKGQTYLVWQQEGVVFIQKLNTFGVPVWPSNKELARDIVGNFYSTSHTSLHVAYDSRSNEIIVAWIEDMTTGSGQGSVSYRWLDVNRYSDEESWSSRDSFTLGSDLKIKSDFEVIADRAGNTVMAWGYDNKILLQKWDRTGEKLWAQDVEVGVTVTGTQESNPQLVSSIGNIFVAWESRLEGDINVYLESFSTAGVRGSLYLVGETAATSIQRLPKLALGPDSKPVLVWLDNRFGNDHLFTKSISPFGSSNSDLQVDTVGEPLSVAPSLNIASTSHGEIFVTWIAQDGLGNHVQSQVLTSSEDPSGLIRLWSIELQISANGSSLFAKGNINLSVLPTNNAQVLWRENGQLLSQRLTPSAQLVWPENRTLESRVGRIQQNSPMVESDQGTGTYLAWVNRSEAGSQVFLQHYVDQTTTWSSPLPVSTGLNENKQDSPALAVSNDGDATLAWIDTRNSNPQIHVQKIDRLGNRLWNTEASINLSNTSRLDVRIDDTKNSYVAWVSEPNKASVAKLNSDGVIQWIRQFSALVNAYSIIGLDVSGSLTFAGFGRVDGPSESYSFIDVQRLNPNDGSIIWAAPKVFTSSIKSGTYEGEIREIDFDVDGNGNTYVAWISPGQTANWDIYFGKVSSSGQNIQQELHSRLLGDQHGNYSSIRIAANRFGQWNTAWRTESSARYYNITSYRVFNTSLGVKECCPSIAISPDGTRLVAYTDELRDDVYINAMPAIALERFHVLSGTIESRSAIDTLTETIRTATLTSNYITNGGDVAFEISNDGGITWVAAMPGIAIVFSSAGSDLRWKATLDVDRLWGRTPIIKAIRIEYGTQIANTDLYENDNTCLTARTIAVNGEPQGHAFHIQTDEDWVRFEAISGTTYILQTADTQAEADTQIDLYDVCDNPPIVPGQTVLGNDYRVSWIAASTQVIFVRVTNVNPRFLAQRTGYNLSVRTANRPPIAVIVSGYKSVNDDLQPNIDRSADIAYKSLLASAVPRANIRYLSANPNRDVDGDGLKNDIDGLPTLDAVKNAIQDWPRTRGLGLGVPLFLYMVDHGNYDHFLAYGLQHKIEASELNLWLSNLEATTGADSITVIIEACHSGSFINIDAKGPGRIAARNRVIVTSTSSELDAYPSDSGIYFSDELWTALAQNQDLKSAFERARQAIQRRGLQQQPWLDDTGDGIYNSLDGDLARGRGLSSVTQRFAPIIETVTTGAIDPKAVLLNSRLNLQAVIRDDINVHHAYVEVYAPDFVAPPQNPDGTTPLIRIPTYTLPALGGNVFGTAINHLTQTGNYRLLVYAIDSDENRAFPWVLNLDVIPQPVLPTITPTITPTVQITVVTTLTPTTVIATVTPIVTAISVTPTLRQKNHLPLVIR